MTDEQVVEWSDPRLPSRLLRNVNLDVHTPYPYVSAQSYRLEPLRQVHGEGQEHLLALEEGPDGVWVGTGRGFFAFTAAYESPPMVFEWMAFSGEGAYEGLSAMIVNKYLTGVQGELEGYIFEGAWPPIPDPVGPNFPRYEE